MYYNAQGRLCSMLASWTDVAELDLFAQASADRSWFRIDDLQRLCCLIADLKDGQHVK